MEYEEILGYHLEQSYRYRLELAPVNRELEALGARAAGRLADAGRRAARRGDIDAASGLLGRAIDLLPPGHPARPRIVVHLGEALIDAGRNAEALRVLDELDGADGVDEVSRALADVCEGEIELQLQPTTEHVARLHGQAHAAIELFARHDDDRALLRACWVSYLTSVTIGRSVAALDAIDRLGALADRVSHPLTGRLPGMRAMNLAWGPTPVPEALAVTESILRAVRDDPGAEPFVLAGHAYLLAQAGEIAAARLALDRMREIADRQGQRIVLWASWGQNVGRTELLAGDPERAERALRPSYEALREAGNRAFSSTLAGQLAHALVDLGRPRGGDAVRDRGAGRIGGSGCPLAGALAERACPGGRGARGRRGAARARRPCRRARGLDRVAERDRRRAPRPCTRAALRRRAGGSDRRGAGRSRARNSGIPREGQHGRGREGNRPRVERPTASDDRMRRAP